MNRERTGEIERLQKRVLRLAEDKSYLQLMLRLIEQLNPLPGIEFMVDSMVTAIVETIGGTNIQLWYWFGDEIRYVDFLSGKAVVTAIDDPLALQVLESGQLVEVRKDVSASLLNESAGPDAWTWVFPLLAGHERIGVIKIENIHISANHMREQLPIFFRHVALILSNEVRNQQRLQAEERLRLAASVFTHAREGIMIADPEGFIIDVNEAFSHITGYGRDEVVGKKPSLLHSGRQSPDFYAAMWRSLLEKGHWAGEVWNRRKSGEVYAELLTISAVRDAGGGVKTYVALFSDITAQKEYQRQLERIAHYDPLTGLPNRVLLADRLTQAMAQAKRRSQQLAVVYIDLDGFKAINDNHGHEVGDQLLTTIASRMKQALREGDTISRLGGDEFVAVLIDLPDIQASVPLILRLLAAAAQPMQTEEKLLQVSGSIGVTFFPQSEDVDADQLLRQSDQAMYQAKLAGKNRYHIFDAEHDRSVRGHHESIERFRLGLENGEFVLHYQPKANLRTGEVLGVEALLRWQHPQNGLLPPGEFLPEVEDHQLGVVLGEWVLESAFRQVEAWQASGLDLPVSVNISARHLQQPEFVEQLRDKFARHPTVRPDRIELEVLETSALEDIERVSEVIAACAAIGVDFALDDFGTGYSSLTYLKRLPAHILKIDQSFVRDMLDDPDDLAILESVLNLAQAFRRRVVAEGVESVEHGVLLLQLGCELAQGYGIARPMPPDALPAWVANWRPESAWTRTRPIDQEKLPVLFASVEHRAWIKAIEAHLAGQRDTPPPIDPLQCRFGQWLAGALRRHHRGQSPLFEAIDTLHKQVHAKGGRLLELRAGRKTDEIRKGLDELRALRDDLLRHMQQLLQGD